MRLNNKTLLYCTLTASAILPLFSSCDSQDTPDKTAQPVPEGMVEVRPALPGIFSSIPRNSSEAGQAQTRAYEHDHTVTNAALNSTIRLPEGSTVWLIAKNEADGSLVKNSYVVYNSDQSEHAVSYLMPCEVDDAGNVQSMAGTPLYLKEGTKYKFCAVSPARKLDETLFSQGKIGFHVKNGSYFYAHDWRYEKTTPDQIIEIKSEGTEGVQEIKLQPMINQTAQLKFQIKADKESGVHDLDIQPSGIEISGLQNDSPDATDADGNPNPYGTPEGIYWHMSQAQDDEPINLQHSGKSGIYHQYGYTIDAEERVNIEVPILPMWSYSKPVIVVFRLKVNGVPTSYEMMLNEKDFKAGYSYGYRGMVSIEKDVAVITWQYVSWEYETDFPFN